MGCGLRHANLSLVLAGLAAIVVPYGSAQVPTASAVATPAEEATFDGVAWSTLSYSAHKFFLGAKTTIRAERLPSAAVADALRRPPNGTPVALPTVDVEAVSVTTDLPFGRDEAVRILFDPTTGAAIGGEKTMLGRSAYHKLLRYTEGGLFTWRASPASDREAELAPDRWSHRKSYLVEPAVKPPAGTPVADSYALLYLVSAARLDRQGSSMRLVMLADDRYVEMVFVAGGLTYSQSSFEETWPGGSHRRQGDVLVRRVKAVARALDSTQGGEDVELGFLGMRGTLTILLEVGTGLPVSLSGRVEHIGDLTVRLNRAALLRPPAPGHVL